MIEPTPTPANGSRRGPDPAILDWSILLLALVALALAGMSLFGGRLDEETMRLRFYQSAWYRGLVGALALLTAACLMKPRRWSAGFVLTHLAFLLLVGGALLGSFSETRAYLRLAQGESGNELITAAGEPTGRLPFTVRLNRFSLERYPQAPRLLHIREREILAERPARTGEVLGIGSFRVTVLGTEAPPPPPPAPARLVLRHPPDGTASVDLATRERTLESHPAPVGATFVVAGLSAEVTVLSAFRDFVMEGGEPRERSERTDNPAVKVRVRPLDGGDTRETWLFAKFPDFGGEAGAGHGLAGHGASPALRVRVEGPERPPVEERLVEGHPLALPEGGTALYYDLPEGPVKDFLSDLSVLRDGGELLRRTVEVNHPLVFEGWRLFQTSYDEQGHRYSIFQVVRDPWLPLFYAGALLMVTGTALLCLDLGKGKG